jgi:hypothetical protein
MPGIRTAMQMACRRTITSAHRAHLSAPGRRVQNSRSALQRGRARRCRRKFWPINGARRPEGNRDNPANQLSSRSAGLVKVETQTVASANSLKLLAGATGLEPATSGVTGRQFP